MDGEASYKKLRDGSWGVRTVGYVPDVGDTVEVTTKGGEVKQEEVAKVVWSGKTDAGDETSICEVVKKDRDGNPVQQQQPRQQQQGGGGQRGGNAGSTGPKCRCHACGTTQAAEYYCGDCVINGGAQQSAGADRGKGADDEIPF